MGANFFGPIKLVKSVLNQLKKKSRKAGLKGKGRRQWRKLGTVTAMSIIRDAERFPILK